MKDGVSEKSKDFVDKKVTVRLAGTVEKRHLGYGYVKDAKMHTAVPWSANPTCCCHDKVFFFFVETRPYLLVV